MSRDFTASSNVPAADRVGPPASGLEAGDVASVLATETDIVVSSIATVAKAARTERRVTATPELLPVTPDTGPTPMAVAEY